VEVRRSAAGAQLHVDSRVASRERAEPRDEPAGREGGRHADHERRAGLTRAELVDAVGEQLEALAQLLGGEPALIGELEMARRALEQRHAEIRLEPANLVT